MKNGGFSCFFAFSQPQGAKKFKVKMLALFPEICYDKYIEEIFGIRCLEGGVQL